MHAVTPLLTGIRGAENGYAQLFERGTATRATWYESFEGDGADSSGDDISLDENGGAEVYVDQLVDVVVLDSDGVEIRRFTDGVSSSAVEVRSQSFTGTNYDDASSGAGSNYPTTVAQVLDLWKATNGGKDWKVSLGGADYSIQTILTALDRAVYNVRAFGALGDGVADDGSAIASAVLAAQAAGGGIVFFPPGTYRVTAAIDAAPSVDLIGAGSQTTAILTDHASASTIGYSGTALYAPTRLQGLRIGASQSNSGSRLVFAGTQNIVVSACYLGGANSAGTVVAGNAPTALRATFVDCVITGTAKLVDTNITASSRKRFERCRFVVAAAAYTNTMVLESAADFVDCEFDTATATSGTVKCFEGKSTTLDATLRGCRFPNSGGATVTAITLGSYLAASVFEELASVFGSSVTAYSYDCVHAGNSKGAIVKLRTRERRRYEVTDNTATLSGLPFDQYGIIVVKRSTNADQSIDILDLAGTTTPPDGSRSTLIVWNASGAQIANENFRLAVFFGLATHTAVDDDYAVCLDFTTLVVSGTSVAHVPVNVADQKSYYSA